ncbi:14474_t:CDS:2, partial [Cetraspora pellucida]
MKKFLQASIDFEKIHDDFMKEALINLEDETFDDSIEEELFDLNDFNQNSDIDVEESALCEAFMFDWNSLKELQEKITKSIEEFEDKLSDDEFFESNNEMEILEREYGISISSFSNKDTFTCCVVVNNNDDSNIIQSTWKIDSQAMQEANNDTSKLKFCISHLNYDQKTIHKEIKCMLSSE